MMKDITPVVRKPISTVKTTGHENNSSYHPEKVIISVRGVSQSFDVGEQKVNVLKDVNFDLEKNTFNIIYGPSGSGKSTLLNILTGLQKPTTGQVQFNGKALYNLSPDDLAYFRSNEIGIVYQQNFWVKSLNVLENVSMPLFFSGHTIQSAQEKALESLRTVGMADYAKKNPTRLSGGEQQRIALARALVNEPLFIIADEPTGNLDSKNGDTVMSLLKRCQSELGRTIILVTHNMEYIPMADYLIHIQDGEITKTNHNKDIRIIADQLLKEMKCRIDHLGKADKKC